MIKTIHPRIRAFTSRTVVARRHGLSNHTHCSASTWMLLLLLLFMLCIHFNADMDWRKCC